MDGKSITRLPLGENTLVIESTENGYDFSVTDGKETVRAFRLIEKRRSWRGIRLDSVNLIRYRDHADPSDIVSAEIITPDNMPEVILKDGRPFCRKCFCFVPDTANCEMRREGCFAHSHTCETRGDGEVYLMPASLVSDLKGAEDHACQLISVLTTLKEEFMLSDTIQRGESVIATLPGYLQGISASASADEPLILSKVSADNAQTMGSTLKIIRDEVQTQQKQSALVSTCLSCSETLIALFIELEKHWTVEEIATRILGS